MEEVGYRKTTATDLPGARGSLVHERVPKATRQKRVVPISPEEEVAGRSLLLPSYQEEPYSENRVSAREAGRDAVERAQQYTRTGTR